MLPCATKSATCGSIFDPARIRRELSEIETKLADPAMWTNSGANQPLMRDRKRLEALVADDVELVRRTDDIGVLAKAQLEILKSAFGMLAMGGRLLYSTCSVLPDENQQVVERFLQIEPGARAAPFPAEVTLAPGALDRGTGVQFLPGAAAGTDGFYYACVEKTTART